MKAWELLGATSAPNGPDIRLTRRDDKYVILANGRPLMSSRLHGSQEALGTLGCTEARTLTGPRVLVGGLGMGFTLRAVLNVLPSAAVVTVAELVPAVIQWNRESLAGLAGYPLGDARVRIEVADVGFTLRANRGRFDLLDADNGPAAFTVAQRSEHSLRSLPTLAAATTAPAAGRSPLMIRAMRRKDVEFRDRLSGARSAPRPTGS